MQRILTQCTDAMYFEPFFLTIPLAFSASVTITSKAKCLRVEAQSLSLSI